MHTLLGMLLRQRTQANRNAYFLAVLRVKLLHFLPDFLHVSAWVCSGMYLCDAGKLVYCMDLRAIQEGPRAQMRCSFGDDSRCPSSGISLHITRAIPEIRFLPWTAGAFPGSGVTSAFAPALAHGGTAACCPYRSILMVLAVVVSPWTQLYISSRCTCECFHFQEAAKAAKLLTSAGCPIWTETKPHHRGA